MPIARTRSNTADSFKICRKSAKSGSACVQIQRLPCLGRFCQPFRLSFADESQASGCKVCDCAFGRLLASLELRLFPRPSGPCTPTHASPKRRAWRNSLASPCSAMRVACLVQRCVLLARTPTRTRRTDATSTAKSVSGDQPRRPPLADFLRRRQPLHAEVVLAVRAIWRSVCVCVRVRQREFVFLFLFLSVFVLACDRGVS